METRKYCYTIPACGMNIGDNMKNGQSEMKSQLVNNCEEYVLMIPDTEMGIGVMPYVLNVRVYNGDDGKPCAIYLDFADHTSTSAAIRECADGTKDEFNIENGITICLIKKLLDMRTLGNGSATYNKLVKRIKRKYEDDQKMKKEFDEVAAMEKKRYNKIIEKKKRRRERLEQKRREEQIEIQKEAILRALRESKLKAEDLM